MKTSQFIYIQIIVMDKNKYKVIYIGGGESEAKELGKYKKESLKKPTLTSHTSMERTM